MAPRHVLPIAGTPGFPGVHSNFLTEDQVPLEVPSSPPVTAHLPDPPGSPTSAGGQGEVPRGTVLRASVTGEHSVALQEEAGVAAVADLVS